MMPEVVVYSKAGCGPCIATRRWLETRGVEFTTIRTDMLPEAAEKLRRAGHMTMPVVEVRSADGGVTIWTGFRPSLLEGTFGGNDV